MQLHFCTLLSLWPQVEQARGSGGVDRQEKLGEDIGPERAGQQLVGLVALGQVELQHVPLSAAEGRRGCDLGAALQHVASDCRGAIVPLLGDADRDVLRRAAGEQIGRVVLPVRVVAAADGQVCFEVRLCGLSSHGPASIFH